MIGAHRITVAVVNENLNMRLLERNIRKATVSLPPSGEIHPLAMVQCLCPIFINYAFLFQHCVRADISGHYSD